MATKMALLFTNLQNILNTHFEQKDHLVKMLHLEIKI